MSYRYLSILLCLLLQACIGCRSELALLELLEPRPAHLATDSTRHELEVRYKRPPYAQSIPSGYDYGQEPQPVQKSGLVAWAKAKLTGGKVVDKSTTTVNIYNAPTGNKKSNIATGQSSVTAQEKVDLRGQNGGYKTKEKPREVVQTITKTTPWYVFAVLIVASVYAGAKFNARLRWLPGLGLLVALCLASAPASAQKQLIIPHSRNYDHIGAKRVEREHRKARRQNHRQNMRELRKEGREHQQRLKLMREMKARIDQKPPH
ncbi:hypothetical protein [Hymenobacter crusticola]|uniref:Uncharacterized protein n=1 Tax=Hymenobacter crusticola TaxID=1770526 RepID=A0A243W5H0_9BACT|nr:hypothetical protein [Hymenobacter crusticola]OUJ68669.1 hypothetical protein BXP70_27665 [Hymenobacter crusticola]